MNIYMELTKKALEFIKSIDYDTLVKVPSYVSNDLSYTFCIHNETVTVRSSQVMQQVMQQSPTNFNNAPTYTIGGTTGNWYISTGINGLSSYIMKYEALLILDSKTFEIKSLTWEEKDYNNQNLSSMISSSSYTQPTPKMTALRNSTNTVINGVVYHDDSPDAFMQEIAADGEINILSIIEIMKK